MLDGGYLLLLSLPPLLLLLLYCLRLANC